MKPEEVATLLEWKRTIAGLYAHARSAEPEPAWRTWKRERDRLFAGHPQSPLPKSERAGFSGLRYFDYDPNARVEAMVVATTPERYEIATSGPEPYAFTRFAEARFEIGGGPLSLELYWLEGYGGGLFLPFRDATAGYETYGAGRYLLDTVKGADLGGYGDRLTLDFNYAYHPSCAYDPRWICPLAPASNRLEVPIRAGERL